ncbi:MAG: autotransporter-associated beta strand repeat-containing protein [Akkermansiaceae bacterium]|nr:autotransporter-associated beta strand repeat-containing protein [Akkermansiaceae bacterium]
MKPTPKSLKPWPPIRWIGLILSCGLHPALAQVSNNSWVYPSSTGNLIHRLDERGQSIADFSNCGYRSGNVPLPDVQREIAPSRWVTVSPGSGDDTALIQNAINTVKAMTPDANGWRGVVYLNAGEYQLANTVTIDAGGIVLKGAGDSPTTGTRLRATATRQYALINVTGSGSHATVANTTRNLIQKTVPAGARTFEVDSAAGYAVGHTVRIQRPSTAEWIADIDMDQLGPQSGGSSDDVPWTAGSKDLFFDRVVTNVDGNWITVDAPLPQTFESQYGGGKIWRYTWSGRIQQAGVEGLYGVSDYTSSTDENHGWTFIRFSAVQHGWVRDITAQYFGHNAVLLTGASKWITVADSQCLDPISQITGGRRYAFSNEGAELTLFINCYSRKGRHDFVFGSTIEGPNAYVQCKADTAYSDTGPHHRWAVGGLFDNITVNGNAINVQNRGNLGTGHGWAGAYMAVWNSTAGSFRVRNPPTARNWLIGSIGPVYASQVPVGADPAGTYESSGTSGANVFPRSLYFAQLQQRMKWPDSYFREVWLGDIDEHYSSGGSGNTQTCDPAWLAAVTAISPSVPTDSLQDHLTANRRRAFTLQFTPLPGESVASATLSLGLRATGSSSSDDRLFLDSTTSPVTLSSLGWTPLSTTVSNVRTLTLDPALLADGKLNIAIDNDSAVDFAALHLQIQKSGPAVRVVTLNPSADAYTRGGVHANSNFGTDPSLATKDLSVTDVFRESWLRWNLTGQSGRLIDAKVRLTCTATSQAGNESAAAFVQSDTWGETTITHNNRPSSGNLFTQWIPVTGQAIEFSVLPHVMDALAGDGALSLKIFSTGNYGGLGNAGYASRENTNASLRPQLILTFENNAPVLSPIADASIPVNGATGPLAFTVSDPETAAASLSLTATSSNPTLVPANGISFGGSGQNRTISLTPVSNALGTSTITVNASDGTLTASTTFQLTVTGTPEQTWRFTHFGTTLDSGNAADTADPDFDGWTNAQERAAGSNPNDVASQPDGSSCITRYWNATPRSNTWQPSSSHWNTAPLGAGVQGLWNPGDDAVFDRPETYTVSLPVPLNSGPVAIRAGQVSFDGSGSVSTPSLSVDAGARLTAHGNAVFREGATTFTLNGDFESSSAASNATRVVTLQGSGRVLSGALRAAAGTFAGSLTGNTSLFKSGTGTLILTGSSDATGAITVESGTLQVGDNSTTGAISAVPVSGNGTLAFHRSDASSWAGSTGGALVLRKSGTNTLTLTGDLNHTGGTVISGGVLQIGDGGSTGNLTGGTVSNSGTLRFNRSGLTTCGAVINGGSLSKIGTGTLVLTGNNNFGSGTFTLGSGSQNVGHLRLAHPKALGNHTKIHLASSGASYSGIEVAGDHTFTQAIDTVGRNSTAGAVFLRHVSGFNTWSGNITITSGGGSYGIESLAGELVISGNIGVGNFSATARNLFFTGAGDITLEGSVTDAATLTIAMSKSGPGTLRIQGSQSCRETIQLTGGSLVVNGSVAPAINVAAGATLGGSGTIASATLSGNNTTGPAILSPGDASPGTLTSTQTIQIGPTTRIDIEIDAPDDEQSPVHDRIVASQVQLTASPTQPFTVRILPVDFPSAPSETRSYPIISADTLIGFDPASAVIDDSALSFSGDWSIRQIGTTLELVFSPDGYNSWIAGFPGILNPAENADPDGDGWTNRDEWIAGTDPTSHASRFTTTVLADGGLSFTRIPGRTYLVETSTTLADWSLLSTIPSGTGPVTVPPPLPVTSPRFYRVRIEVDP